MFCGKSLIPRLAGCGRKNTGYQCGKTKDSYRKSNAAGQPVLDVYKRQCPGISQAAAVLKRAVAENRPIHVVADYDADGLGAVSYTHLDVYKRQSYRYAE